MTGIQIVYENEDVLVLNKPSGITVHPDGKTEEETITHWILKRYPKMETVGEPMVLSGKKILRPGIVHRLDKETSGILLIAKTQDAFLFLKKQFQERTIIKKYAAILHGVVKKNIGEISAPIGRSKSDFRKRSTGALARGELREALTLYTVRARSNAYSFVEAFPKTGRTHQIRVHFHSIGHPVLCDPLYAAKKVCPNPPGRLALHAFSLEFETPKGERMTVEAEIPEDMGAFMKGEFWKLQNR